LKKRRSRTDVAAQILQKANGGVKGTTLTYGMDLASDRLVGYILCLAQNGLLEYEPVEQKYWTTERGFEFLQTYDQMSMLSNVIDVMKHNQS
jgi:predicted transcriptional regulator